MRLDAGRWIVGLAVVVLQLGLSAAVFDPSPHTGGDNAGYVTLGYSLLERGAYLDLHDPEEPIHIKYPPVYPAVLAGAMLLGARTWTAFKVLSALFMAGAVLMAFLWIERRRGVGLALTLAVLLAVSEAYLFHTRWILSDPLFLVLTLASLWAFSVHDEVRHDSGAPGMQGEEGPPGTWLALACVAAILAFFTRSAGLPLVLSVAGVLALRHRWRALGAFGLAFAVPALFWWLRSRGAEAYASEFWLVDPYRPDLGRAGMGDLALRIVENARAYWGRWIPGGLIGLRGGLVTAAGGALALVAAAGWWRRLRTRRGLAELFTPLYLVLILLWPPVWTGDRFALPLYPLVLFYVGDVLLDVTRPLPVWVRRPLLSAAVLVFLVPAAYLWRVSAHEARACRDRIAREGVFACYTAPVREYVKAAEWTRTHLPRDARVMTRKPRLFYVLSGLQSRPYPLTRDAVVFLDEAMSGGMTHVVMDYLDNLGSYYLAPVIQERTGAFCSLVGFGAMGLTRTEIFGILSPGEWEDPGDAAVEDTDLVVNLRICAGSPPDGTGPAGPPYGDPAIPLLEALDARRRRQRPPGTDAGAGGRS